MRRNVTTDQAQLSNIRKQLTHIHVLAKLLASLTTEEKISQLVSLTQSGFHYSIPKTLKDHPFPKPICNRCCSRFTKQGSEICNQCRELYGDSKKEDYDK